MKTYIKFIDIFIILLVAVLTFFAAYMVYMKPQGSVQVLIRGQNGEWVYPVTAEETVVIPGPLGNTVVRLHERKAWIETSPCENKTCIGSGAISEKGQWAACLPNNVLLLIHSSEEDELGYISW